MESNRLTPRQKEVLKLVKDRYSNKDIAEALGITVGTVKQHISSMMVRTGSQSRRELSECYD